MNRVLFVERSGELRILARLSNELEIEKIKEMVPTEEIKENLASRKTVKFLVENAVAKAE